MPWQLNPANQEQRLYMFNLSPLRLAEERSQVRDATQAWGMHLSLLPSSCNFDPSHADIGQRNSWNSLVLPASHLKIILKWL